MASDKEQEWLNEYLVCFNATEAARRVGYKWPNKIGPEKKKKFADEIKVRLEDKQLSADEVLSRLSEMATGNLSDFAHIKTAKDLEDLDNGYLIKKFKIKLTTDALGRQHEQVEIELYDAQSALRDIGKQHGLFTDKHIVNVKLEQEVDGILDVIERVLDPDSYDRVLSALSGSKEGQGEAEESGE